MAKLYTKRGDAGVTDLFNGSRIDKDALRVEAFGTVDELNSIIGLAAAACEQPSIHAILLATQSRLFELGADLATPADPKKDAPSAVPRIGASQIATVEKQIDEVCSSLDPMKHFILPGGCVLAAHLHLARTVCRRAERLCVALNRHETLGEALLIYLNRLSDLLFALARLANHHAGVPDVPWRGRDAT